MSNISDADLAYRRGAMARRDGVPRHMNPHVERGARGRIVGYDTTKEEALAWEEGWRRGEKVER